MNTEPQISQEIVDRVNAFLYSSYPWITEPELQPAAHLLTDIGFDDLDMLDLWIGVEKEFDISIPAGEYDQIVTLADLHNLISAHMDTSK